MIEYTTQKNVATLLRKRLEKMYTVPNAAKLVDFAVHDADLELRWIRATSGGDLWLWDFLTDLPANG